VKEQMIPRANRFDMDFDTLSQTMAFRQTPNLPW